MMKVREAHHVFLDLCNTLGTPVIKAIADGADDLEGDAIRLVSGVLGAAAQNLSGPVSDRLLKTVFKCVVANMEKVGSVHEDRFVTLDYDSPTFDAHFRGRLLTMYKVWAWAISVNYRDFLDGAQSLGSEGEGLGRKALGLLQTQTDPSGQSPTATKSAHH